MPEFTVLTKSRFTIDTSSMTEAINIVEGLPEGGAVWKDDKGISLDVYLAEVEIVGINLKRSH